jgi:hypothetical protein
MKRLSLAILALSLMVSPALAQQPGKKKPAVEEKKKHRTLDIEAIDVDGNRAGGQITPISVHDAAKVSSLIRIRRDFVDLIHKSAEQL